MKNSVGVFALVGYLIIITAILTLNVYKNLLLEKEVEKLRDLAVTKCDEAKADFKPPAASVQADHEVERTRREVVGGKNPVPDWVKGVTGPPGRDGRDGARGPPGPPGPPGSDGRDAINFVELNARINGSITKLIAQEEQRLNKASRDYPTAAGATYTHWGRKSCPTKSSMLYRGRAAAQYYSSTGGGANVLCLPDDPQYSTSSSNGVSALVYGVEYEVSGGPFSKSVYEQNMPCVVCQADKRASSLMTPAKLSCPDSSWSLEYSGYLMTSGSSQARLDYICVDKEPESVVGMYADNDPAQLWAVGVSCSSLGDCPPYKASVALTCSVCTK